MENSLGISSTIHAPAVNAAVDHPDTPPFRACLFGL
jgi:hypothetical protein